jgi:hypothetical protein
MKIIYSLLPVLFIIACANNIAENKTISESKVNEQNAVNGASMAEANAFILIRKDGKNRFQYYPPLPKALRMTEKSGKEILMIVFDNPDNTISLMITANTVASGTYTIGSEDKSGAQFSFTADITDSIIKSIQLPFMMNLSKGNLKITLAGQTCSGSFTTRTENDEVGNYEISGFFTAVPITKIVAGQTP